jgi:hypothetical protein
VAKKPNPLTEAQGNLIVAELGVLATCALLTLYGAWRGIFTVTKTASQVKDVAEGMASRF